MGQQNDYSRFYNQPHTESYRAYAKMFVVGVTIAIGSILGVGILIARHFMN